MEEEQQQPVDEKEPEMVKRKKMMIGFMDSFKTNLIEMFKEQGDEEHLKAPPYLPEREELSERKTKKT